MLNSTIQKRIDKVNSYLSKQDTAPLVFVRAYTKDKATIPLLARDTIESQVREVINMASTFSSFNTVKSCIETLPGRMRSATDIWRHIKSIRDDISIFDIMEVIYNLCINKDLYGHYCFVVHRSVFRWKESWSEVDPRFKCRDYGNIRFSTWKKLHIVEEKCK